MEIERYQRLAEAYGGDVGRWPEAERQAALEWRARDPDAASAVLAAAAALDAALDAWRPPAATADLRERVLATAPRPRPVRRGFGFWLSGAGLAAAGAAGVIFGMAGFGAAVSDARADDLLAVALPDDPTAAFAPFTVSGRQAVARAT
jgi:ferric-dicitrate binding protein FerR (iron transport regulator)